jgi:hypothetical protein
MFLSLDLTAEFKRNIKKVPARALGLVNSLGIGGI